jgi:hypothetical protein
VNQKGKNTMRHGSCVLDEPPANDGENTQLKKEATQSSRKSDKKEEIV